MFDELGDILRMFDVGCSWEIFYGNLMRDIVGTFCGIQPQKDMILDCS